MFINKPSVTDFLPDSVKEKVRYVTRIFPYLKKLKETKDNKTIKGSSTSQWKLCVRPFQPKSKTSINPGGVVAWITSTFFKKKTLHNDTNIYFYDEVKGGIGTAIGYSLPGHVVKNTITLLEEREKNMEALIMQKERNADIMKADYVESTHIATSGKMTPNPIRKKSDMLQKARTPNLSRKIQNDTTKL